jgi:hypothetical protein
MSDVEMLSVVIGFLSPPVLAVIQQTPWKPPIKAVVTFIWAIVLGALTTYFAGEWSAKNVVTVILVVLATAVATYQAWWKNFAWIRMLERSTSYWPKTGPVK